MIANGQELKRFIHEQRNKQDIICIQETWLKPHLSFVINGYICERNDRVNGSGGGCATFIKQGIPYRILGSGSSLEYIVVQIWGKKSQYGYHKFL